MLLASHQTTLETFVFISPVLHYISPVMNVCPEPAERNPILTGCEGASGWAASAPYCMLDTTWASLSSLSQYLSQEVRVSMEMSQFRLEEAVKIRHLYCYLDHMD